MLRKSKENFSSCGPSPLARKVAPESHIKRNAAPFGICLALEPSCTITATEKALAPTSCLRFLAHPLKDRRPQRAWRLTGPSSGPAYGRPLMSDVSALQRFMKKPSLRPLASGRRATERAGRRSHFSRHSGIGAARSSALREIRLSLPWFAPGVVATGEHRSVLSSALRSRIVSLSGERSNTLLPSSAARAIQTHA